MIWKKGDTDVLSQKELKQKPTDMCMYIEKYIHTYTYISVYIYQYVYINMKYQYEFMKHFIFQNISINVNFLALSTAKV